MSLDAELTAWDGKSAEAIRSVYDRFHSQSDFVEQLLVALRNEDQEQGASWLIKHHLEAKHVIDAADAEQIYTSLRTILHWQTKLHLLQSMPYLPVTDTVRPVVEGFVRQNLTAPNKFVRAWAYNGLYLLALQYPELRADAEACMQLGIQNEPASVKARIRRNLKTGFPG